ncbi:fimbrial protein [Dyella sp. ASV21]|uniref:fimbrial protein n=1 Tax=Dyella sp. ASV21 TaxID=2795114 RepID=UPI0018EA6805|nr:fimbrial protein [Dyella sp. ASV21]
MNKLLLSTALVASVAAAALAPRTASAVDGTINITGTINTSTCQINGANSPATIAVALPTVSTTSLNAANAVAGRTPFTLALSGCGALTKATTFFEPGPTVMADGNLKNNTGTATNVEVQLLNSNFSTIALNAASGSQNVTQATLASGAGNITYYAQYFATAAAGAGTVNTSVQFTMLYQ